MADSIETPPVLGVPVVQRHQSEQDRQRHRDQPGQDAPGDRAGPDTRDVDVDLAISLMGISVDNTTPEMRRVLGGIVTELENVRGDLDTARMRVAYLEQAQDIDAVLPVGGRLALLRRLSRALHRSELSSMSNALVVLHVAGAHSVRMRAGRPAVERLLAEVADRIKPALRETDFLAALGGYDFGLLLPLADASDAEQKARSLAAGAASRPFESVGNPVTVSLDWGLVAFGAVGTPEALLDAADADLVVRRNASGSGADRHSGNDVG